jgi:hypothetical protein
VECCCSFRGNQEQKDTEVPISPSKAHPQRANFLPLGPTSYMFHPLPNSATCWWPNLQHVAFGRHLDPNYNCTPPFYSSWYTKVKKVKVTCPGAASPQPLLSDKPTPYPSEPTGEQGTWEICPRPSLELTSISSSPPSSALGDGSLGFLPLS